MSSQTLTEDAIIDLDRSSPETADKPKRWWAFFTRPDRPRMPWMGRRANPRNELLEEFRREQQRLTEALARIDERLDVAKPFGSSPEMKLDPMPVLEGIRGLGRGQAAISESLQSLSGLMERAGETDQRLAASLNKVDQTLSGVRSTQSETVQSLVNIDTKLEESTRRFEAIVDRMTAAEQAMAADYRKLQSRTLIALSAIGASVIAAVGVFISTL